MQDSNIDAKVKSGNSLKAPPVSYYLVMSFSIAFLMLIQDGFFRYNGFLRLMNSSAFMHNALVLFAFFILIFLSAGILFCLLDNLGAILLSKTKNKNSVSGESYFSEISGFLYFAVFAYTFANYFKFLSAVSIPGFTKGETIEKSALAASVLFIILIIAYFVSWRKKLNYNRIAGFVNQVKLPVGLIVLAVVIAGFVFYSSERHVATGGKNRKNMKPHIILISMDSARNRNMNVYGYKRENTPSINKIADVSYIFDKMMSSSNSTPICLPVMINGRNPRLDDGNIWRNSNLLSILRDNGYNNRLFVSEISSFFPDLFTEYLNLSGSTKLFRSLHTQQINNKTEWLIKFISQDERYYCIWNTIDPRNILYKHANTNMDTYMSYVADKVSESETPVFVWIHFMETHYPFGIPSSMRDVYKGSSVQDLDKFDISILYVDSIIGKLKQKLILNGEWDNSMIIITADHGSSFPGDLPYTAPYNALVMANGAFNIPFIIHLPGQKKRVDVKTMASQIDMAPTLLELLNLSRPETMEGESLKPYMDNPAMLSQKLKISLQGQYFLKKMPEGKSQNWADNDYINAFYDRFMTRLSCNSPVSNRMSEEEFRNTMIKPQTVEDDLNDGKNDQDEEDDSNAPIDNTDDVKTPDMPAGKDFLKYKCYGIFNLFEDPAMKTDIYDSETGRKVLEVLKNSPIVNSYQDTK
jgi:arylsulfatase A-like enzyme